MLAASARFVEENRAGSIQRQRRNEIDASLRFHARHPERIPERLAELDREWEIERVIDAHTASVALAGLLLGTLVNRKFLIVTGVVSLVLMQHAVFGWCPRVAVLRRLGFRTAGEIWHERCGLEALRDARPVV